MEPREEDVYTVQRPVYCLREFDQEFTEKREETSLRATAQRMKNSMRKKCTTKQLGKRCLTLVPFFSIMRSYYKKSVLATDIIAGITLAIFHIPQGSFNLMNIDGCDAPLFLSLKFPFLSFFHFLSSKPKYFDLKQFVSDFYH